MMNWEESGSFVPCRAAAIPSLQLQGSAALVLLAFSFYFALGLLVAGCNEEVKPKSASGLEQSGKSTLDNSGPSLKEHSPTAVPVQIPSTATSTDQEKLTHIVLSHPDASARRAAWDKITNQSCLAEIAIKGKGGDFCYAAVQAITNEEALAKVAIEAPFYAADALRKLKDLALVTKVAVNSKDAVAREAALDRLSDAQPQTSLTEEKKDLPTLDPVTGEFKDKNILATLKVGGQQLVVQRSFATNETARPTLTELSQDSADLGLRNSAAIVLKAQSACASIPREHRTRFTRYTVDLLRVISQPALAGEIGDVKVTCAWSPIAAAYAHEGLLGGGSRAGERFSCTIVSPIPLDCTRTWATSFPDKATHLSFLGADVRIAELLWDVFARVSQQALSSVALSDFDNEVRKVAVSRLSDPAVLSKVAKDDGDPAVRAAAAAKLAR